MPDPVKADLDKVLAGFRRSLLKKERGAASQLVRYYGEAWKRIRAEVVRLTNDYNALVMRGENTEATLLQLRRLKEIKAQTERELSRFAKYAGDAVLRQEREAILAASKDAVRMVQASFWPMPPGVELQFNRLSTQAIENMIATFQVGSPVHARLLELAGTGAQAVQDGLTQGLMLGQGAREIARNIRAELGANLSKALTWSRTETLRAYRGASLETYRENADLVNGWMWRSARNERTCAMCWAMDGTLHGMDEPLDDHPNGRCFAVPHVKTWEELGFPEIKESVTARETGVQAFAKLSDAEKLKILGPAKFAAYQDGAIKLEDLVGQRPDPRWGSMRYEKSLKEMGKDSKYWLERYGENPVQNSFTRQEAVERIIALHNEFGGSTFSLNYGDMNGKPFHSVAIFPDKGMQVIVRGKEIDPEKLEILIRNYQGLTKNQRIAIGTWYNEDDDHTYIEFSLLVKDRDIAIQLGKKYNQIGIYDLGNRDYIPTGGTGEPLDDLPSLLDRLGEGE